MTINPQQYNDDKIPSSPALLHLAFLTLLLFLPLLPSPSRPDLADGAVLVSAVICPRTLTEAPRAAGALGSVGSVGSGMDPAANQWLSN